MCHEIQREACGTHREATVSKLQAGERPALILAPRGFSGARRLKMASHPNRNKHGITRTSQGLRDILFDEIQELRNGNGDPTKAMAVANLAKQIINTAKVELDFHRTLAQHAEAGTPIKMGSLQLGSGKDSATSAGTSATGA